MTDPLFIQGLPVLIADWTVFLAAAMPSYSPGPAMPPRPPAPGKVIPFPGQFRPRPRGNPFRWLNKRWWLMQLMKEFIPQGETEEQVNVPGATQICEATHGKAMLSPTKQLTQASCTVCSNSGTFCQNMSGATAFGTPWNVGFSRGLQIWAPAADSVGDCAGVAGRYHFHSSWGYCGALPKTLTPEIVPGQRPRAPNYDPPPFPFFSPPGFPQPNVPPAPNPPGRPRRTPGRPGPRPGRTPARPGAPRPRTPWQPAPRPGPRPNPPPWIDPAPYEPLPGSQPSPVPAPVPSPAPDAGPIPSFPPLVRPSPVPGTPPVIMAPPGVHKPVPPGPGVKERKVFSPLMQGLLRFYHEAGEVLDIVDCMHDALPKKSRAKVPRYQNKKGTWVNGKITTKAKMKALYNGFDKPDYDMGGLTKCLIENEIEDQIVGRIMAGSSGAIQFIGRGLGWGPAV